MAATVQQVIDALNAVMATCDQNIATNQAALATAQTAVNAAQAEVDCYTVRKQGVAMCLNAANNVVAQG